MTDNLTDIANEFIVNTTVKLSEYSVRIESLEKALEDFSERIGLLTAQYNRAIGQLELRINLLIEKANTTDESLNELFRNRV